MLNEDVRKLSDEEKIANAFKSENNPEKIEDNIKLMNSFARGGLEILYERFQGLANREDEILQTQSDIFEEFMDIGNIYYDDEIHY